MALSAMHMYRNMRIRNIYVEILSSVKKRGLKLKNLTFFFFSSWKPGLVCFTKAGFSLQRRESLRMADWDAEKQT